MRIAQRNTSNTIASRFAVIMHQVIAAGIFSQHCHAITGQACLAH
ncbi:hypothetical protein EPIB2_725 [Tritonibacter mobilis]|nr:hypothetical protein EPIB2_725 [Tritonibacter mobilis]